MTTAFAPLPTPTQLGGIVYLSGCTNPPTAAAARQQPRLGMLAQPGNSIHLQHENYAHWGIDNGAFGHARKVAQGKAERWGQPQNVDYLAWLRRITVEVDTANVLFANAPDVLSFICLTHNVDECRLRFERMPGPSGKCKGVPTGNAEATWEHSSKLFPAIRNLGLPVALVAQDGINAMSIDYDAFDVLFLGGSDDFKLGYEGRRATQQAKQAGKWVHMGRVNSLKRLQYATKIGCDSADGTYIGFGPDKNLPQVLAWLEATRQPRIIAARTPMEAAS